MKYKTLSVALTTLLLAILATKSDGLIAQTGSFSGCTQSRTVWIDASPMKRRKGAAEKMTDMHDTMSNRGWTFTDMEIYTENSDLEGFFLTYCRDTACG